MIGSGKAKSQNKDLGLDYIGSIRLGFVIDNLHRQLDELESPRRHTPGISVIVFPERFI